MKLLYFPKVDYGAVLSDVLSRTPVVIGGGFNAWAIGWGSRLTNAIGYSLLEALAR